MSNYNVKRANAKSIINRVMSNANGINTSKIKARANSDVYGENGHKVSTKTHSIKETQNLRTVTTQYIGFVKENYPGRVAANIHTESAMSFLSFKAETVGSGTLNTYTSLMNKVSDNLNKDKIGSLSREIIKDIKTELKKQYSFKKNHINRAYKDVEAIQAEMKHTTMNISSDLQIKAGLRVDDAINSSKWTINSDNSLTIKGSKGGIEYTTRSLSNEFIQKVANAKEMNYKANYTEYRETIKEAIEATGQDYNGSHGLRYNFAQERQDELMKSGRTRLEADAQTSLELGHSRISITAHYTTFK